MNVKMIISLLLICTFSFCCSPEQKPPPRIEIIIEDGVDPNTIAVVTLKLEGDTLPGTPKVVSAEDTAAAIIEGMGTAEDVRQIGENNENKWVAILTAGESYVIGWIVEDNKMFGYCSEPFVAEKNSEVAFSPGMPMSLEYSLENPPDGVSVFPAIFVLSRKAVRNGDTALMSWGEVKTIEEPGIIKVDGLAQGVYQMIAQAALAEQFVMTRELFLFDKRDIEIKHGSHNRLEAIYPEYDTTVEEGDVTIRGLAHNSAGEVLPGEAIQLIPYGEKGPLLDLYYKDAVTDSNGTFEFTGVRPNTSVVITGANSGIVLSEDSMTRGKTFWLDFLVGSMNILFGIDYIVPEFDIDWKDGLSGSFDDLLGKIVVVDVWASWCAPCKKALPELNSLAEEFQEDDDVVFVALSIDSSRKDWEEAVNKSGWDALCHGWYDRENPLAFNRPIPYSMVIDKKGIVRAAGNGLDIRAELEKVINASE